MSGSWTRPSGAQEDMRSMSKKPRNPKQEQGAHSFVSKSGVGYDKNGGFPIMRKGKTRRDRAKKGDTRR